MNRIFPSTITTTDLCRSRTIMVSMSTVSPSSRDVVSSVQANVRPDLTTGIQEGILACAVITLSDPRPTLKRTWNWRPEPWPTFAALQETDSEANVARLSRTAARMKGHSGYIYATTHIWPERTKTHTAVCANTVVPCSGSNWWLSEKRQMWSLKHSRKLLWLHSRVKHQERNQECQTKY